MINKYCSFSKDVPLYQAKNAIILAAGLGKRLLPLTVHTPKSLMLINGLPIIEHQIQYLKAAKINEIYVVVGHLKEKFRYLQNKYKNICLIENRQYSQKNNISSLQAVFNYFSNSYVIEGDLLIKEQVFSLYHDSSSICCLYEKGKSNEWGVVTNKNGALKQINFTAEKQPHLIGISFWIESDATKIRNCLSEIFDDPNYDNMFWEEASYIKNLGEFHIKTKLLNEGAVQEIDTLEDLINAHLSYKSLKKNVDQDLKINNVTPIKTGITNSSYLINCENKDYIIRFPKTNNRFINRSKEYKNIKLVEDLKISEQVVYFDKTSGIKLSHKLEGITLSIDSIKAHTEKIAKILKRLHLNYDNLDAKDFKPFKMLREYMVKNESFLSSDYFAISKELVAYCNKYVTIDNVCFCHNDLVPENFINNNKKLYLIDWEYSGINDPIFDLASLFDECKYNLEDEKRFLNAYGLKFSATLSQKITFWQVYLNLLWSVWCHFFENEPDFDHYRILRLNKAKELLGRLK